jgi:hypothetical protein
MRSSYSEKETGEMTSGDRRRADNGPTVRRVVAEGDITRRRRGVAMSANLTEGEKQKENALRIGRDALLEADLESIDRSY